MFGVDKKSRKPKPFYKLSCENRIQWVLENYDTCPTLVHTPDSNTRERPSTTKFAN
jgi:hypothetical protein